MDMKELSSILQQNGIVGAGGAGFPTYAKLDERAETIILNCAECEPLLRLHRQLLEKYAKEIIDTFHMIGETVGAKEVIIGIKKAYTATIEAVKAVMGQYPEVRLGLLDEVYPAGDEVVLIYETTGKVVRPGGLPIESGVAVFNVETVYNVYRALNEKTPVEDKLVSVVAEVEHPITVRVPIGTPLEEVVALAGGVTTKDAVYFVGGPMMGNTQYTTQAASTKGTSGILCLSEEKARIPEPTACLRCGRCTEVCPAFLQPLYISANSLKGDFDKAEEHRALDCIECGSCSFICPARRPLVESIRNAKRQIQAKRRKAQAEAKAKAAK